MRSAARHVPRAAAAHGPVGFRAMGRTPASPLAGASGFSPAPNPSSSSFRRSSSSSSASTSIASPPTPTSPPSPPPSPSPCSASPSASSSSSPSWRRTTAAEVLGKAAPPPSPLRARARAPGADDAKPTTPPTPTTPTPLPARAAAAPAQTQAQPQAAAPTDAVALSGWVRSVRVHKTAAFISVSDGSCAEAVQVVVAPPDEVKRLALQGLATGAAVTVRGAARPSPRGAGHPPELHAREVELVGPCDARSFPLQKKDHSGEFLREIAHLRPRSAFFSCVLRVRSRAARVVRDVLERDHGFVWVSTPILSANDCEGAGELFHVSVPGTRDFFATGGKPVFLTVSGQLHAEMMAAGLSRVYTFGPTFRAENSNTTRHLAEFWMLEPEMSFATMHDAACVSLDCVSACARDLLENGRDELATLAAFAPKHENAGSRGAEDAALMRRLERAADARSSAVFMPYAEAVAVLGRSAGAPPLPAPRQSLSSEHERFLVEKHCGGVPVVVHDFPREIKPFYALANDDAADTAAAFDVLVDGIGELVGGSAREHRFDRLQKRMRDDGVLDALGWYLDLREFGTAPHAGFGIGFDRLVQFLTGQVNIRDVVPVHRARGELHY